MKTEANFIKEQIQKRLAELAKKYLGNATTTFPNVATLQCLLADLSHTDRKVRRDAAFALGDLGNSLAVIPLAEAFYAHERRGDYFVYDQPDDVQLAIAMALFCLGESKELSVVLSSESGHLRRRMVKALKEIDSERASKILTDALLVKEHALSYWMTRALGELRDRRALEPLLEVLQQHRVNERVAAADSLGGLGDERAVAALEQAREKDHHKNWMGRTVSQAATMAIDEILRSKGIAPRYAHKDIRYVEWVRVRFRYEAELFVAEVKRKQGVTLAYDKSSVAWLDSHIDDIRDGVSPEEREGLVRDVSTFFGECLRHCYDGKWKPCDGRWAIAFDDKKAAFPFTEVSKALEDYMVSLLSIYQLVPLLLKANLPVQQLEQGEE